MTAAPPPPAPPGPENGFGGPHPPSLNMNLPRFHPIAMSPHGSMPPEPLIQNQQPQFFRHYGPPVPENGHPHPSPPSLAQLDHIEARLRQLEQDEAARMAARSHLLAMRKREDEEFRRITEHAEFEEEELRRQRKRLKRESMGLNHNGTMDSPPMRPEPAPRRLSETSAATTLAFFKQQSPPEPRPAPMAQPAPPPAPLPPPPPPAPPQQQQQQQQQQSHQDGNGAGSMRRRQKYTIKNVEAWGERHGRPAAHDPSGRALWRRPSDGNLVYLTCPVSGCGKSDFVTLHGFMCHLTKKHKDRTLGSQSRALEVCGVIFDPNAPPPPPPPTTSRNRASTDESRLESSHEGGYQQELEYSSNSDDGHEHGHGHDAAFSSSSSHLRPVKSESTERPMMPGRPTSSASPPVDEGGAVKTNGSVRQSISSIIDRNTDGDARDREYDASGKGAAHGSYAAEDSRHAVDGEMEGDGRSEGRVNGTGHSK